MQAEWVNHKAAMLSVVGATVKPAVNLGYGTHSLRMRTSCLPCIDDIASLALQEGRKVVTTKWLDQIGDLGLAWWYCDDGSKRGKIAVFHTEGYSGAENHLIRDWLSARFGRVSIADNCKGHLFIRMGVHSSERMWNVVRSHVPSCMAYKLGGNAGLNL